MKGYSVLIVTAHRGVLGLRWTATAYRLTDATFNTYRRHVNDLQTEFDRDCDPVRAYVCCDGMPVFAGGMPEPRQEQRYPARRQRGAGR
jgi:hypothetical protein